MQQLHTDQGKTFESNLFQEMTKILGIKKTRTTPYHPQSDGLVERMNRSLKDMLSKVVNSQQDDWDLRIPQVLLAYRTMVHTSTGFSPHRMMFGREARMPIDLMLPEAPGERKYSSSMEYVEGTKNGFREAYEIARGNTNRAAQRYKDYYDAKSHGVPYDVGDRVWLHIPHVKKGKTKKLTRPWHGPYVVIKRISDVVYRIELEGSRRKRVVVHFDRLKKCFGQPHVTEETQKTTLEELSPQETSGDRNDGKEETIQQTDSEDDDWTVVTYRKRNQGVRTSDILELVGEIDQQLPIEPTSATTESPISSPRAPRPQRIRR